MKQITLLLFLSTTLLLGCKNDQSLLQKVFGEIDQIQVKITKTENSDTIMVTVDDPGRISDIMRYVSEENYSGEDFEVCATMKFHRSEKSIGVIDFHCTKTASYARYLNEGKEYRKKLTPIGDEYLSQFLSF